MKKGVVIYTWGNVSGISDDRKYMVIKPSGVDYKGMSSDDMVVVDIESGCKVEGKWKPSSDTPTHIELYRIYKNINVIAHTHSVNAVYNAVVMEKVAEMALKTLLINQDAYMNKYILDKHYLRKHGKDAYYGQD